MKPNEFLRLWRRFQRTNPEKAKAMEQEATILPEIDRGLRCPQCRESRDLAKPGGHLRGVLGKGGRMKKMNG